MQLTLKIKKLGFKGRLNRAKFWQLVSASYGLALIFLILLALQAGYSWSAIFAIQLPTLRLTGRVIFMIAWCGLLGAKIRRLNDLKLSHWLIGLDFIPVVGALVFTIFGCLPSKK